PAAEPMPGFLEVIDRRGRYVLYEARPSSYFAIGRSDLAFLGRKADLLPAARFWLRSRLVAAREFPRVLLTGMGASPSDRRVQPLSSAARLLPTLVGRPPPAGRVLVETAAPQSHTAHVLLEEAATVVLTVTYHPNWRATVNGVDMPTMMVMPSFIGIALPAGRHEISLAYRSDPRRVLLLSAGIALIVLAVAVAAFRRLRRRAVRRVARS
ncbi:MAG: YfhO family protein, partial [Burkholderiales bacterium]